MNPISDSGNESAPNRARVVETIREQAGWCAKLGSPFTARLLEAVGAMLDRSTRTGRTMLDWPGDPAPLADALALRLAGGLHAMKIMGS